MHCRVLVHRDLIVQRAGKSKSTVKYVVVHRATCYLGLLYSAPSSGQIVGAPSWETLTHCTELQAIWCLLCRVHSAPSFNRPWDTFYGSNGMLLNRDRICSLKTAFILTTTTDTDDWEMIVTVSSTNIWPNLVKLLWIHQKIDHQQQIPTQPIRFRLKASGISYMISIPPFSQKFYIATISSTSCTIIYFK